MELQILRIAKLSFILLIFCSYAHAQTTVGIRTGMNLTGVNMVSENGYSYDTRTVPQLLIGLTVDIPLIANFYLQPSVLYTGRGFKQDDSWFAHSNNEFKVIADYIDVPVNLIYKPKLGAGNLLLGSGPYVGYGIGGRWESEEDVLIGDIRIEGTGKVVFKDEVMDGEWGTYLYGRPWDYGASFLVGYEFLEKFSIQLNGQLGIANLQPKVGGTDRGGTLRNRAYGISVGYTF